MKRRKPVLELDNIYLFSRESSFPPVASTPVFSAANTAQSLVSYSEDSDTESSTSNSKINLHTYQNADDSGKPYTAWQACVDENTGYTYYWNVETNEVTWEIPPEYLAYETSLHAISSATCQEGIHPITKYHIAKTTQEVIANRYAANVLTKKSNANTKPFKEKKIELVPYGPTWEDDGSEDAEAKKIASARKRLLSYKSYKLKNKTEESDNSNKTPPPAPPTSSSPCNTKTDFSCTAAPLSQKTDSTSCKIPFVPTPDEIKEHPIFSNFTSPMYIPSDIRGSIDVNVGATDNTSSRLGDCSLNGSKVVRKLTTNVGSDGKKPRLIDENYSDSDPDEDEDDNDENLDDIIITRLRKKALLLEELGGDVPKEILSVLDNSKTAEDIIAEIEKEIPPDSVDDDCTTMQVDGEASKTVDTPSETTAVVQPLFPIIDYIKETESKAVDTKPNVRSMPNRKTQMKNIQKIKLSSRARELIKTSLLTAKARATNFVETADGLKPAEEVQKMEEAKKENSILESDLVKSESAQTKEETAKEIRSTEHDKFKAEIDDLCVTNANLLEVSSEPKIETVQLVASSLDSEAKKLKSIPNTDTTPSSTDRKLNLESYSNILNSDQTIKSEMKFSKPQEEEEEDKEEEKPRKNMYGFQSSFVVPNTKRTKIHEDSEAKRISLVSKCEEFLQSVQQTGNENAAISEPKKKKIIKEEERKLPKKEPNKEFKDVDIDDVLNTKEDEGKNITDLSQLIMEKLKFLNDGKGSVTPVQVMTIQIETLVGAWQTQALTSKYLMDWLDVTAIHLKSIEDAAAPEGWQCEWDRTPNYIRQRC